MNTLKFEELNLSKELLKAVLDMGFSQTTPIQAQAIPEIISGQDIIGQASTGTGKTAAFGLPAIEKIDPTNKAVQVLVLCPTRELAMQVTVEISKFLKYKKNISALAIYGGQPISKQLYDLRRNPQIIIGTPGRTLDHIERGTLRLNQVKMIILDEADEMLNMGFRQDIEQVLKVIPKERQTVLFSATMSSDVLQLTKNYQRNPKHIKVDKEKINVSAVEQICFDVEQSGKVNALMDLINTYNPKLAIVFCNTKRRVDVVSKELTATGYKAAGIHGDIRQSKRDSIMSRFRNGGINILVATDVAARGIDVANVEIVFNYEIPRDAESYVHRIGRTGRAGKTGKALSLVSRSENGLLRDIKYFTRANILHQEVPTSIKKKSAPKITQPTIQPVIQSAAKTITHPVIKPNIINPQDDNLLEEKAIRIFGKIRQRMSNDELSDYLNITKKLTADNNSPENVAAALLKMVMEFEHKKAQ